MARQTFKLHSVQTIVPIKAPGNEVKTHIQVRGHGRGDWQIEADDRGVMVADSNGAVWIPWANVASYRLADAEVKS